MKRQLQCTAQKTTTHYFALASRSRTHLPSFFSYLISFYSARTSYVLFATLARFSSLLLFLGMSASLMPMHLWLACIHYMHALHLVPTTYMLPYCTCILLISCFVAPCILYMILVTLCSVPVQRTSRQSWLCRCLATSAQHPLPVMSTLHMLYNSLVQEYESESPTNSGVIEDTGNSTCAVYLWRI